MAEQDWNARIEAILETLRQHPEAGIIHVVGSVARGSAAPGDLDIVVDRRDSDWDGRMRTGDADLLRLGSGANYGLFDPFLWYRNRLLVRNDHSTGWMMTRGSRTLKAAFLKDMVPLHDLDWAPGSGDAGTIPTGIQP